MARITRQHAALVRAYAEANGLSPRTAQHHRKIADPRWVTFAQVHGLEFQQGKQLPAERGGQDNVAFPADYEPEDLSHLSKEEEIERRQWIIWQKASREAEKKIHMGHADAPFFIKASEEARKSYETAKDKRIKADIEARRLIPYSAFVEFAEIFERFAAVGRGIVREIGERVNPQFPEVGIAVLEEWVQQRHNPACLEAYEMAMANTPVAA